MANIFYLIIVLTVLFVILNVVIIFRLVGGIIREFYREYRGTSGFFNFVDRCPYLVGNSYFT